jgi:CRP-like cAMP-binding protein/N-acyl-L-homoserine lactone synthetase
MDFSKVRIAGTEAEKEEIYRLRYQVYIEEMGGGNRHTEADLVARQLRDEFDERAYHFYVRQDGVIAASARLNLRRDGPLECEDEFELSRFAPAFPNYVSMSSRMVLHSALRGSHLLKQLTCAMYQFARSHDIQFDFLDSHPRLLSLYCRLGHRIYKAGFRHPKYVFVIPMVLVMDDLEHLEKVKSPFIPLAKCLPASVEGRELLLSRFPEAAQRSGPNDLDLASFWEILRTRLLEPSATIHRWGILTDFTDEETKLLMSLGHVVSARAANRVLCMGDPGREIFLILDGSFQVEGKRQEGSGEEPTILKILGPGDIFGEIAFLTEGIRGAAVVAMEDATMLVLNAKSLEHLVTAEASIAAKLFRNIARIVATRYRDTMKF